MILEFLANNWFEIITIFVLVLSVYSSRSDRKKLEMKVEKKVESIGKDVAAYSSWSHVLSADFRSLMSYLKGLSKDAPRSGLDLHSANYPAPGPAYNSPDAQPNAQSNSPLTLTPHGEASASRMGASDIVKKCRKHILVPENANKFIIQERCLNFALNGVFMNTIEDNERDIIQNEVFERAEGMEETLIIFGILFRDAIFKERKLSIPIPPHQVTKSS